ncbi:MAG: O-antigen ligase family protein [Gaiellaceae bacterium]
MARVLRSGLWRPGRDLPFLVLCAALAASMIRAVDQPAAVVAVAGTDVAVTPTDAAIAALAVLVLARLLGAGALPRPARAPTLAAAAFSGWLLLSSALNGADALSGAAKVLEYGVLALGTVLFVQRRAQLWLLLGALLAVAVVADVWGLVGLITSGGVRQGAFLGSHDLPALGTLLLAVAGAILVTRSSRLRWFGVAAALAGALGVVLGAALAGLLAVWLVVAAVAALAAARRSLSLPGLALMVAVAAAVTAAAIPIRSGDLGFVEAGPSLQAESAGSWSQRLIYTYIGWRVFLDNPVLGTGWHGQLPPSEWAHHLDDARARFPDQPPHYFPRPNDELIPQQTYDQVLFELGLVGALLFLGLAVVAARAAVRVGRAWPRGGPDEPLAYLPAAWLAAIAAMLAGAALYGGLPLMALFWLTLGVVALAPSLMPPPAR